MGRAMRRAPHNQGAMDLAPDEQVDDIGEMIKNLIGGGGPQGFLEVQRS